MNKSRIMRRAWAAYRTKKAKFEAGKLKNAPSFSSCLKWSWKMEKENKESLRMWNPKENFYRFYDNDGGYVQVSVKERAPRGYYETHRYCKGDVSDLRTGFYKLVNFSEEKFEQFKLTIELSVKANLKVSNF